VGQRARMMAEAARDVGMPSERLIVLEDVAEAIEVLRPLVSAGDVVLIKGSRALHMERIVAALGKSD